MHRNLARIVATTLLASATCLVGSAAAQTLEGEWTNALPSCGQYTTNNFNIVIRADGYRVTETVCEFAGGTKFSSSHWVMRAACTNESSEPPVEFSVEMRSLNGRLILNEDGQITNYRMKCDAAHASPF